ncbi:hypothetical protein Clacol_002467 [Clathrus columnatus]|uniref:Uncharacterized protein n=1 Tax=Clathrus columnatus TaxID=1419009 RepID=A0AAV5A3R7_9AGAM|nr:hypothetical protein Clacol_002467 [Clathrus columnatus]
MYPFLRSIIDARAAAEFLTMSPPPPPPPPPPPYEPLPTQPVRNDNDCAACNRQPLNHLTQPHYHTFQPHHHHHHHHNHHNHHSHNHGHTTLTLLHRPPITRNTVYVRRSTTFSLCWFLFFLVLISTILSLFWLALPQLDGYARRLERIRRRHEQGVAWSAPLQGSCLRSGVREYSATLRNYQVDSYWKEACETTELFIHGREVYPKRCELSFGFMQSFFFGFVIGHWEIDFGETSCTPIWSSLVDEGCVAYLRIELEPNKRRFSARLLNVDQPDQWDVMCAITPAEIQGNSRMPHFCKNQGILGMWGYWDTFDQTCSAF